MCHVKVDAEKIPCFAFISPMGFSCFVQAYEVVYTYGQTEFKAQLRWEEEVFDQFFYVRCHNRSNHHFRTQGEEKRCFHLTLDDLGHTNFLAGATRRSSTMKRLSDFPRGYLWSLPIHTVLNLLINFQTECGHVSCIVILWAVEKVSSSLLHPGYLLHTPHFLCIRA